jgi:hypothetical protein
LRKTFSVQITPASILCCEPFPKLAPEADFMVSIPYLIRFFYCFFSFCWSYLHLLFHSTLCWLKPIRILLNRHTAPARTISRQGTARSTA